MCIFKNKKLLKCFAVVRKNDNSKFLTVTETKEQCFEYANTLLKLENFEHYQLWCKCRNYNLDDKDVWNQYFTDCLTEEDKCKYNIVEIKFNKTNLIAMIRMFAGCIPLNCSFDLPEEYVHLKLLEKEFMKINEGESNGNI